ncbi:ferritin-like domain-containing protein [Paenibacillus lemnae]|uniref:Ferritin-like domain-containing protein n=1 Tax=Paenibacillus lemnae TaxID=1330551 RepID=A0A848M2M8_PAELE|nr:ferritin-like domain-containing protein [Paenibacillus lemnae]NMO94490.1 ferritin-like domain-containing protein [Paenibacillus lemnae]
MYANTGYPHPQTGINPDFIRGLEKAINGEYSAIICYEKLAAMAPVQEQRDLILEIRKDEIRHYRYFTDLYVRLTGRQSMPQMSEPCPEDYRTGVLAAFRDEQETVDAYLTLSDQAPDQATRDMLRRIAADEQQHAVWFLSILTLPQRC